ncbi:PREDICTED: integumentary mucin C.1-like [Priapulus caudatus]|uniref:Integumentary mucin C.1-like n=1 Tax=Priapulus caudatus TaxID=37621 RepID=A0ABM1EFQ4_PRICU|nr:PREDICTED: integumentary mucin C.1-like [Priapulus caudatus]
MIPSPGYPFARTLPQQKCSWLLKAPHNGRITLWFDVISTAWFGSFLQPCPDYVEFKYRNDSLINPGARFCGYDIPTFTVTTETNEAAVLLRIFTPFTAMFNVRYVVTCKDPTSVATSTTTPPTTATTTMPSTTATTTIPPTTATTTIPPTTATTTMPSTTVTTTTPTSATTPPKQTKRKKPEASNFRLPLPAITALKKLISIFRG